MSLGETIKALRDEKRLSMRGLAKAVDVTPMHISNDIYTDAYLITTYGYHYHQGRLRRLHLALPPLVKILLHHN